MERIIKFSVPEYESVFDCQEELKYQPYCICYQYDVKNQYGPYGFNTEKSKQFVRNVFGNTLYWDVNKLQLVSQTSILRSGINFYGNLNGIQHLYGENQSYIKIKKKNELLVRYNKEPIQSMAEKPLIADIFDGEFYKSTTINKLLQLRIDFFIVVYYAPEAGDSLLLFDNNLIDKIKHNAHMSDIDFVEFNSINDLKSW